MYYVFKYMCHVYISLLYDLNASKSLTSGFFFFLTSHNPNLYLMGGAFRNVPFRCEGLSNPGPVPTEDGFASSLLTTLEFDEYSRILGFPHMYHSL